MGMILADPINCTIPTIDALKLKGQEITCSTSLIDSAKGVELMWTAIEALGAVGSLIVTIFMARFAWKAWQTSKMQLKATLDIALADKRLQAMPDFINSVRALAESFGKGKTTKDILELEETAYLAGEHWALTYPEIFQANCIRPAVATIALYVRKDAIFSETTAFMTSGQIMSHGLDQMTVNASYGRLKDLVHKLYGGSITEADFIREYSRTSRKGGENELSSM